jgi:hypothetical protein
MSADTCQCPVVWHSWGCQVEHQKGCPVWESRHRYQALLARLLTKQRRETP